MQSAALDETLGEDRRANSGRETGQRESGTFRLTRVSMEVWCGCVHVFIHQRRRGSCECECGECMCVELKRAGSLAGDADRERQLDGRKKCRPRDGIAFRCRGMTPVHARRVVVSLLFFSWSSVDRVAAGTACRGDDDFLLLPRCGFFSLISPSLHSFLAVLIGQSRTPGHQRGRFSVSR